MRIEKVQDVDKHDNKIIRDNGIRYLHCFKEDKDFDAPKIVLPANEVSESDWWFSRNSIMGKK